MKLIMYGEINGRSFSFEANGQLDRPVYPPLPLLSEWGVAGTGYHLRRHTREIPYTTPSPKAPIGHTYAPECGKGGHLRTN